MKEKKSTTESFDGWDSYEQQTYRTGGTQPPKSHGSLIAFLLVVVMIQICQQQSLRLKVKKFL